MFIAQDSGTGIHLASGQKKGWVCQSAPKRDPLSASKRDPLFGLSLRRVTAVSGPWLVVSRPVV